MKRVTHDGLDTKCPFASQKQSNKCGACGRREGHRKDNCPNVVNESSDSEEDSDEDNDSDEHDDFPFVSEEKGTVVGNKRQRT